MDQTTHFIVISFFPAHRIIDVMEFYPNKTGKFHQQKSFTEVKELRQGGGKGETPGIALLSHSKKKEEKMEKKMLPPVLQTGGRTERAVSFLGVR